MLPTLPIVAQAPPSMLQAAPASPAPAPPPVTPRVARLLRDSGLAQGVGAVASLQTLTFAGPVSVAGVPGTQREVEDLRSGAVAGYIDAGPFTGATGTDGSELWNRDASGVVWTDSSLDARRQSVYAAYLARYGPWTDDRGFAAITDLGRQTAAGLPYDVLGVTPPGAPQFSVWLDPRTHLPLLVAEPVGGGTVTTFSTYRAVRGLRVPFVQSTAGQGQTVAFAAASATADAAGAPALTARPLESLADFTIAGDSATTVPFELDDDRVVVRALLDDRGPYRFVLDTGNANAIDAALAATLGVGVPAAGAAASAAGVATTLQLGAATLQNQPFTVRAFPAGVTRAGGAHVDGVLGFDVLSRFVATIDYASRRLTLALPASTTERADAIPFVFENATPAIPCAIAGAAGICPVNTGSPRALGLAPAFAAANGGIAPAQAQPAAASTAPGATSRVLLQFGRFALPDTLAELRPARAGAATDASIAGTIGGGTLRRFAVILDYPRRTVAFVPNGDYARRTAGDASGLVLAIDGGAITVASVAPASPAAAAGVLPGDTIAGRVPATAADLASLRARLAGRPGTTVRLRLTTPGAAPRDASVVLGQGL